VPSQLVTADGSPLFTSDASAIYTIYTVPAPSGPVYGSYTLADIQEQLVARVDGTPFWTYQEMVDAINEALLTWNALTGFWKQTVELTTSLTANWDYQLPASLVFGMRVEFNGRSLAEASLGDMDYGHPGWQAETTADGGNVPNAPQKWLPLSIDMIAIWPADATGGNTLTVDGVSATPQLVNPSDYIDIGNEELSSLLGYVIHLLAFKEGGERFKITQPYFTAFLAAAAEENDQLQLSSEFRHLIGTDINRQTRETRGSATPYDALGRAPKAGN
jgi:hypothetical protein